MRILFLLLCLLLLPSSSGAVVFQVTKLTDDDGSCTAEDCSLREAIQAANALPGPDVVAVPAGTYQLELVGADGLGTDLDITDDVEILGVAGSTTINGSGLGGPDDRVFSISGTLYSALVRVRLVGLRLTGGHAEIGGGLSTSLADLELVDCLVEDNEATSLGGGIAVLLGRLELLRTSVLSNRAARWGGGINRDGLPNSPTSLFIRNSTVAENFAASEGGAISTFGGGGEILIESSTIAGNEADFRGSLIFQNNSIGPQFVNSVLEGDCFFISSQFPQSLGGNVGTANTEFCLLDQPSDQPAVPELGLLPLGDYGGPTPTHALLPTSPAIDAALLEQCPLQDQRGESRPVDGDDDGVRDCDAGAVELQRPIVEIPVASPMGLLVLAGLLAGAAIRRTHSARERK